MLGDLDDVRVGAEVASPRVAACAVEPAAQMAGRERAPLREWPQLRERGAPAAAAEGPRVLFSECSPKRTRAAVAVVAAAGAASDALSALPGRALVQVRNWERFAFPPYLLLLCCAAL